MTTAILPLSDSQAKQLAGKAWCLCGQSLTFQGCDPGAPGQPPWKSGVEGKAYPLWDAADAPAAYVKFYASENPRRRERAQWLIDRHLPAWLPQLRAAPALWADTRAHGRPEGIDFDFTGCVSAAAPGETWLEVKQRLATRVETLSWDLRWRLVEELLVALALLEQAGLVHGDLSPANLVINLRAGGTESVLALIDFDAFAVAAEPEQSLTVAEGGTFGTEGYCPLDLSQRVAQGDLTAAPYSDRRARDLLLVEFLFAGPGMPAEEAPSRWDRHAWDNRFQSLLGQSPSHRWAGLRQLAPATVGLRPEAERLSSTDFARAFHLEIPNLATALREATSEPAAGSDLPPTEHHGAGPESQATGVDAAERERGPAPHPVSPTPTRLRWRWLGVSACLLALVALAILGYRQWKPSSSNPSAPLASTNRSRAPAFTPAHRAIPPPRNPAPSQRHTNSLGLVFTPVPGVAVWFSIWETRVQDFALFAAATERTMPQSGIAQGPTHPVVSVTWDDAKAFCAWLTEVERALGFLQADQSYRLPTDAEWSVAVGLEGQPELPATTQIEPAAEVFPWGHQWPPPEGAGNYGSAFGSGAFPATAPVGSFAPNRHGLYDLGGNAEEWCEDRLRLDTDDRCLRGGSWTHLGRPSLASTCRSWAPPSDSMPSFGFRLVLVANPSASSPATSPLTNRTPPGNRAQTVAAHPSTSTRPAVAGPPHTECLEYENTLGMRFAAMIKVRGLVSIWETRVEDYEAYVRATRRAWSKPTFEQGPTHPAANVTWAEAQAFCQWLTEKERGEGRLTPRQSYRLPRNAEWDHLTGGWQFEVRRPASGGEGDYNLRLDPFLYTAPAGSFPPTPAGLFDLGGNVWEWCEEWQGADRIQRVIRGGGWNTRLDDASPPGRPRVPTMSAAWLASLQAGRRPDASSEAIGFRVVLQETSSEP